MNKTLNEAGRDLLFREARSHSFWLEQPVEDATLHELYELMKWGPTSANGCPARVIFLRTREAKERLRPALAPTNVDKAMTAPVVAIVGQDLAFYERLPQLMPHAPMMRDYFASDAALSTSTAFRNSSLQGAYVMMAARAVGLDCGPMSGFDNAMVDQAFSEDGLFPGGQFRSNFICSLGHGDRAKLFPRNPRLAFDEACALL